MGRELDYYNDEIVTVTYDRIIDVQETPQFWKVVFGGQAYSLNKDYVEDIRETAKEIVLPWWYCKGRGLEEFVK